MTGKERARSSGYGPAMSLKDRAWSGVSGRVRSAVAARDADAAKDISAARQRLAAESTAAYVDEHMPAVKAIRGATPTEAMLATLDDAMDHAPADGLTVEFGVATGFTLRAIAERRSPVYGFDSFAGLPEDWREGYDVGAFAQEPPQVPGAELVVGWFDDTLPKFLAEHPEPFAYVHLDSDLYSSARTILDLAFDRFVAGTVITFDEYFNFPGWQHHEFKAFAEFRDRYSGGYEYLNYNAMHEQVSVRLT